MTTRNADGNGLGKMIDWKKSLDADSNDVWEGASPYQADNEMRSYWRLCQRIRCNTLEWYEDHDGGLPDADEDGFGWSLIEDVKEAVQNLHDKILEEEGIDPNA